MTQNPMIGIEPEQADVNIKIELTGKGDPGYTPQRGVDYWTEEDKQEIVDDVKQEIGELPGGGTVRSVNGKSPDKNGDVVVDPELPSAWDIPSSDPSDPMPYDKVLGTEFGGDGEPKWVLQSPPSAEAVRYTAQTLNVNQQAQARKNIGAQPAGDYALKSEIPSAAVQSVNGKTGDVVLTADDVGAAKKEDVERLSEEIEQLKNGPVDLTEATKSGEIATVTPVAGTTAKAVSKITGQDATWQHANILQLRHLTGKNLFDFTQFFGGVGKVYSQDGLTATINDNGTVTIKGTNTSSGWVNIVQTRTSGENAHFRWIFPAGTYTVPSEITVQLVKVNGGWTGLGNKKGTFTVGEPFWLSGAYIAYASGAAVDSTIPLVMVSGSALPSSGYSFSGEVYTANFTSPITDGEFNWQTGELKDADGSLIETIEPFEEFPVFDGANTFMTGVGVSTVTYKVPDDGSGVSGVEAFDPEVWGLPVLYLNGNVTGMSKDNAVTMNYVYGTQEGTCTVKWQGSTSLSFPKKNYTIKFDTAFEAVDGWGEQKKYCAKANWIDHSHARNVVNAKLWGQIVKSRKTVPTVLANLVNGGAVDGFPMLIVINKELKGLYTFNIPKDGWMFGMGSGTNEAIICADKWVPATYYKAEAKIDGTDFKLEYATDEDNAGWVTTSINRLINACMASDGSDLDTTIAQYLDWDSAIDYLIFTVMIVGNDMTGKNYLNATFDGTKWFFSAYDMDCTYCLNADGSKFLPANYQPSFAQFAANHKVMELIVNHKKDALKARYAELRETVLSESNIATEFANFAGLIPSPVLMQDVKLWPGIPNTSVNNISQVRDAYRLRCMLADKWIEEL